MKFSFHVHVSVHKIPEVFQKHLYNIQIKPNSLHPHFSNSQAGQTADCVMIMPSAWLYIYTHILAYSLKKCSSVLSSEYSWWSKSYNADAALLLLLQYSFGFLDVNLRVASADPVVAIPEISTIFTHSLESSNCPIIRRNVYSSRTVTNMILCEVSSNCWGKLESIRFAVVCNNYSIRKTGFCQNLKAW